MTRLRLKHIHRFRDRHGKVRHYFRRAGCKRVPLPGDPGSEEFMAAYQAALAGQAGPIEIGASRTKPGTVNAAIVAFYNSGLYASWAPETRRSRRNILERFRIEHGDKRIALLEPRHIVKMLADKSDKPSSAQNWLKAVRALMQFAAASGLVSKDPTRDVKPPRYRSDGFQTWDEDHIRTFEARHPIGTMPRLALALLLYSAQRRGDVVTLGRQHIKSGFIHMRQHKTGMSMVIPVHPDLQAVIDATPSDHLTFLTTSFGKPFSAAGFTNWFRERCREAGLPKGLSAHGLRKAACRRLAEAGCSANEIAAISGHASLREVQRYTLAADRKRMAVAAINTVTEAFPAETRTSSGKPE